MGNRILKAFYPIIFFYNFLLLSFLPLSFLTTPSFLFFSPATFFLSRPYHFFKIKTPELTCCICDQLIRVMLSRGPSHVRSSSCTSGTNHWPGNQYVRISGIAHLGISGQYAWTRAIQIIRYPY
mgnify:CR=1 FL=1